MSDLDRDAIRARAAAATPGPWMYIGQGWVEDEPGIGGRPNPVVTFARRDEDGIFAANAREDIPALLAALEEAEIRLGVVEYQRNLYRGQIIELTGRAESAERRIAAVEAEALVWEMSPRGQMAPTRGVGQIIRAALHPVAETTEGME